MDDPTLDNPKAKQTASSTRDCERDVRGVSPHVRVPDARPEQLGEGRPAGATLDGRGEQGGVS
eukprot:3270128-Pyramimonas_sp.AAC.1